MSADTVERANLITQNHTIGHGTARRRAGQLQQGSSDHHKDSLFSSFIKN